MAITQVGLHGPQQAYGTFAPKDLDPGGSVAPVITRVGLTGPMRAYATFTAKAPASGGGGTGAFDIFGSAVMS